MFSNFNFRGERIERKTKAENRQIYSMVTLCGYDPDLAFKSHVLKGRVQRYTPCRHFRKCLVGHLRVDGQFVVSEVALEHYTSLLG